MKMASGCSCRMRKTTACVAFAWMPSLTVSYWSVGTWLPAPSAASA
ncbi:RNF34 isoform 8 [Pongo abelii]|uniref:RNF34 isoform 8 n=1 Tax=Pongo abelii TaxID=9601 RepID=A0A2J8XK38_PONAB|nr:RNF34 isoform 8 [Pongo abelii]